MLSGRNTACARCFSRGPVASLPECSWIPACAGMTGRSLSSSDEPGPPCVSGGGIPAGHAPLVIPAEAGIHRTAQSGHVQAGADPSRGPAHGFWFSTPRLDSRFRGNDEQGSRATACHPRPRMSQSGAGMTESPPLHGFSRGRANPKVIHQGWCPWNPTDFIPDSSPFQAPFWISACAGMTKWGRGTW